MIYNPAPLDNIKTIYSRKLPHFHHIGRSFFITFRLFGSVPKEKLIELHKKYGIEKLQLFEGDKRDLKLKLRRKFNIEFNEVMDKIKTGPHYLAEPEIREEVSKQIHKYDGDLYNLICYSIMSNHVHIVFNTSIQIPENIDDYYNLEKFVTVEKILKRIKGASARYINLKLNKEGQFWEHENFDVLIRNRRMRNRVINYVLENPVKVGIVDRWEDYPGNYYVADRRNIGSC